MSNMKQLALGCMMYAQDNDGRLRSGHGGQINGVTYAGYSLWEAYAPYIASETSMVYYCPSSPNKFKGQGFTHSNASTNYDYYHSDYGFSLIWVPANGGNPYCLAATVDRYFPSPILGTLPDVAKTGMLGEVTASDSLGRGSTYFGAENKYNLRLQKTRHFDGSNFAFADGHVKWIKQEAVDATFKAQTDNRASSPGSAEPGVTEAEAANLQIVFSWRIRSF